jgi:hypothetical protein
MDISLPAWLGALAGTVVGALIYAAAVGAIERRLRARDTSATPQEREAFERRLSVIRRTVLALDIGICAALGYWLGGVWDAAADPRMPL